MKQLQAKEGGVSAELQEKVLVGGDLSKLSSRERLSYLNNLCESIGLNPLTRPFEYINLQGKLTLYARKDATEQLRKLNKISIDKMEEEVIGDIYKVKAYAIDGEGRRDVSTGVVNILNLKADALANALMKAETKAKRRVTLSIAGLGFLDESELDTVKSSPAEIADYELTKNEAEVQCYSENILSSPDMESLKISHKNAIIYARSINDKELETVFGKYKDARKEELSLRPISLAEDN